MPKKPNSDSTSAYTIRLSDKDKAWLEEQGKALGIDVPSLIRHSLEALRSSISYHKGRLIVPVNIQSIVDGRIELERRLEESIAGGKDKLIAQMQSEIEWHRAQTHNRPAATPPADLAMVAEDILPYNLGQPLPTQDYVDAQVPMTASDLEQIKAGHALAKADAAASKKKAASQKAPPAP